MTIAMLRCDIKRRAAAGNRVYEQKPHQIKHRWHVSAAPADEMGA
jgi:hypothetical protein